MKTRPTRSASTRRVQIHKDETTRTRSRRSSSNYNINYAIVDENGFDEVDDTEHRPLHKTGTARAVKNMILENRSIKSQEIAENKEPEAGASSISAVDVHPPPLMEDTNERASPVIKQLSKLKLFPVFGKKTKAWNNDVEVLKLLQHIVATKTPQ